MISAIHSLGLTNYFYFGFHILGYVSVLVFNILYSKKFDISKSKAVIITFFVYSITYVWIYILCWAETGFQRFGGNNIVRGFVYIPLIAFPISKVLKVEWKKMCDFIAPCVCLAHGVSHIGCIFAGCCEGFVSDFGIYNINSQSYLFPVQIFEAVTALLIFVMTIKFTALKKFSATGYAYPFMLVWFGSTRFLWEFARNNTKLIFGCSSLALHALFMAIVGIIAIFVIYKNNKGHGAKK